MKTPSSMPKYSSHPQDLPKDLLSRYLEFTKATYNLTGREAFLTIAAQLIPTMENKYAIMASKSFSTAEKINFIKNVLIPAASFAINSIAKSGNSALINKAGVLRDSANKYIAEAVTYYNSESLTLKNAKSAFESLGVILANLNDQSVAAKSAVNGHGDCGYWVRILWLWQPDFDQFEIDINKKDDVANTSIAKANTAISAIFDIDDSVNESNSYRNTHKEQVAKEEFDEEQAQKKIKASKLFFDGLIASASQSPLSQYLTATLNNIYAAGNLYTDLPAKGQRIPQNDNILLQMKRLMDSFINNVHDGHFNNLESITDSDMNAISAFSGGKITKDDVKMAIDGLKPKPISSLSTDTSSTIMQARNSSAISTSDTSAQAELIADAARKKIADANASLDAHKSAESSHSDIDSASKDVVDAKIDEKDSHELGDKINETDNTDTDTGTVIVPQAKYIPPINTAKTQSTSIMDQKIAGIPVPIAIGGAAVVVGLIAIARK